MSDIGDHYAKLFKDSLNKTIQKTFDDTVGWKKLAAGLSTLVDAQNKGYAPNKEQIDAIAKIVQEKASQMYENPDFVKLDPQKAAKKLAGEVTDEVKNLNKKWQEKKTEDGMLSRQYVFKPEDIKKLEARSAAAIEKDHPQQAEIAKQAMDAKVKQAAPENSGLSRYEAAKVEFELIGVIPGKSSQPGNLQLQTTRIV